MPKPGPNTLPPHLLSKDDFNAICEQHDVTGPAKITLAELLQRTVRECRSHYDLGLQRPQSRELLNELKTLSNTLAKLEKRVRDHPQVHEWILHQGLGDTLASMLTNEACDTIVGERVFTPSERLVESRQATSGARPASGLYKAFAAAGRQARDNLVEDRGLDVHAGLFHLLRSSVDRQIALRQQDKGSRPGRIYRNYLVGRLVEWWEMTENHAERPPGDLDILIEHLLESMGIDTIGLEDTLRRQRA